MKGSIGSVIKYNGNMEISKRPPIRRIMQKKVQESAKLGILTKNTLSKNM
jgi:hypothetical protein